MTDRPTALTLGFLTVLQEPGGTLGGYLVTNSWGRPLEFRLTTAVQPNRVQQILYGRTLVEYVVADLIGKTLVEKTSVQPSLIIADSAAALALRSRIEIPVIALTAPADAPPDAVLLTPPKTGGLLYLSETFVADREAVEKLLAAVDPAVDLNEPFARVREAVAEARKMGVTGRAA